MRIIDPYTQQRFGLQGASLCLCLRITRVDGVEIGLTDHDRDLSFGGTLFQSNPGMTVTGLTMTAGLAPDHAEIISGTSVGGLTAEDVDADRYAFARAELWRVDFEDVTARLLLTGGAIGEVARQDAVLRLEYRGQTHALGKITGRIYQKSCDAQLGDTRCGVDLGSPSFTSDGVVESVNGLSITISGVSVEAGVLIGGTVTPMSGALLGVKRTIRSHSVNGSVAEITLWESFPLVLQAGEALRLTAGCDKRFSTCRDRFSNSASFRGFPDIPGTNVLAVQTGGEG
ncbi:MAG: DUF2163 domain-containing protein [Pseudomonadota bacterium]